MRIRHPSACATRWCRPTRLMSNRSPRARSAPRSRSAGPRAAAYPFWRSADGSVPGCPGEPYRDRDRAGVLRPEPRHLPAPPHPKRVRGDGDRPGRSRVDTVRGLDLRLHPPGRVRSCGGRSTTGWSPRTQIACAADSTDTNPDRIEGQVYVRPEDPEEWLSVSGIQGFRGPEPGDDETGRPAVHGFSWNVSTPCTRETSAPANCRSHPVQAVSGPMAPRPSRHAPPPADAVHRGSDRAIRAAIRQESPEQEKRT